MEDRVRTYYRIIFPSEDPGGWQLPAAVRQAPKPQRQDQTDGQGWGQGIEHLVSEAKLICSSSAWNHSIDQGYLLWFYIFNPVHICAVCCSLSWGSFIFHSLVSLLSLVKLCFILKFTLHLLWSRANSRLVRPLLLWRDTAFTHSSDKTRASSRDVHQDDSCGTEVSDLCLWTSGGR